jgi:SnoaL-like polyketide cyclase
MRNPAVIDELAAPGIRFEYSLHAPLRGRDAVREFAGKFRAAFPDLNFWGTADLIAELTGRDDPSQVSIRHAQTASDLGENGLGGVDARDGDRADSGEQRPSAGSQLHSPSQSVADCN